MSLCGSHQASMDRVVAGVRSHRPKSFLLQAPPACGPPWPFYLALQDALRKDGRDRRLVAMVSADMVGDDGELVDRMIAAWTRDRHELARMWEASTDRKAEPQYRLKAFGDLARRSALSLVAIVPKFGRLFLNMRMKGVLLAALRELEAERLLACVNGATMSYWDLYERRKRLEPSFVSDYGTTHVAELFGRLSRADALELWSGSGLAAEKPLDRHYFELAFAESGGILDAFECAIQLVEPPFTEDSRRYRERLRAQLPETFARMLNPEGAGDDESEVCDACAHLYLGDQEPNRPVLLSARWKGVLTEQAEAGGLRLVCESLGRRAVETMYRRSGTVPPETFYVAGHYDLCLARCDKVGSSMPLLVSAATMMSRVFAGHGHDLYFSRETPWEEVARLARDCAAWSEGPAKREFERWAQLAAAHERLSRGDQLLSLLRPGQRAEPEAIEHVLLYLGTRLLAVQSRRPEEAAYPAIPLPEEALRAYLVLVLGIAPEGRAFDGVPPKAIQQWWPRGKFRAPSGGDRLTRAPLALLVAIRSSERGAPLFQSPEALAKLLQDDFRNTSAHRVITAGAEQVNEQLGYARDFLEALAREGHSSFGLNGVRDFVRPPRAFLGAAGPS